MKDLRIVFVTHYADLYGANRSLLNLIDGLSVIGVTNVLIVAPSDGKVIDEVKKRNVKYHIIPFVNEVYDPNTRPGIIKKIAKFVYNWYIVVRYARLLKSKQRTVLHSNTSATLIGSYFAFWLGIPHVWHMREFGFEDYRFKYNFGYKYFQYWLNKSKAAIAISKAIYEKRLKNCNVSIKRIIYNGVIFKNQLRNHISKSKPCNFNAADRQAFNFLMVGIISEGKNQLEGLSAFARLNRKYVKTRLRIIGDVADEAYLGVLKKYIRANNLEEKVNLSGYKNCITEIYDDIDCMVHCAHHEAMGRVTVEAMSYGIPVVGFNGGGTKEIILHEINGLLYETEDDLYNAMKRIISESDLLGQLSKGALNSVNENYTIDKYTAKCQDVYLSIFNNEIV